MKLQTTLIFGALALTLAQGSAAIRVFNITGATAFRAAANNSILQMLGGTGVTEYAYTGTSGIGGTNRAIFKGTMAAFPGDTIIVRTSWSGSTQGVLDLADANAIEFLKDEIGTGAGFNPVSTTGVNLGQGSAEAPEYEAAVARWSFSDVDKLLSTRPNAPLAGGPVGVVPFMFLAGEGAPAGLTNMSDQLHNALWKVGQLPASMLTGNPADAGTTVLATGRNNGSGTRATILAETQYGAFTSVVQFNATYQGTRTEAYPTAKLLAISEFGNSGNSSNSGVRELLTRRGDAMTFAGDPVDALFVSYLTISDALAAKTEGAVELTYNGVAYSEENVKNGKYTLWGYQQFYMGTSPTTEETTFDTALRATVPSHMGTAGIPIPAMNVQRTGGDGGPIFPIIAP
jgi:hypothetical protein